MALATQRCHDRLTLSRKQQLIFNHRRAHPSIGQRRGRRAALVALAASSPDILRVHYVRKDLAYKVRMTLKRCIVEICICPDSVCVRCPYSLTPACRRCARRCRRRRKKQGWGLHVSGDALDATSWDQPLWPTG